MKFSLVCLVATVSARHHIVDKIQEKWNDFKDHHDHHNHHDHNDAVPTVPNQWKASAVQDMEGNIPGVRPGKTSYTSYYDYPNRHRYEYPTQNIVYDFQAQKAYKIKSNGKCCYKDDTDAMIEIAPTSKAKDMGAKDGGEEWQQKLNLIYLKNTTDFIITSANTVSEWDQRIEMGKTGEQWMTVNVSYTDEVVGGLTDADFLTDQTADCTSTCALSEWEELQVQAQLGWEDEELQGIGDKCTVPTDKDWGPVCRMQELCGTDCVSGSCKFAWPTGKTMDDPSTNCFCQQCKADEAPVVEGIGDKCTVPTGKTFGPACRMQELCGVDCVPGSCKFAWPEDSTMDDPSTNCFCEQCKTEDFLQ